MTVLSNSEISKSECLAIRPEQTQAVEFFDQSGSSPPKDTLYWARKYKAQGWQPVPIPRGEKGPKTHGWNTRIYSTEELPQYFRPTSNIGLLLGDLSGGLIDIDLDCPEAIQLAPNFLPTTDLKSGRHSAPSSHWWYRIGSGDAENVKLTDPTPSSDRATIVEIRGQKVQTLVPPSIHPSEEQYRWERYGEPSQVAFAELRARVQKLAAAVLLVRAWRVGVRQDITSALVSSMLHSGWSKEDVQSFIEPIIDAAGDHDRSQRTYLVTYLEDRIKGGETTPGLPTLTSLLGEEVVHRLTDWLGIKSRSQGRETSTRQESNANSNTNRLLELVGDSELFHDEAGVAFATVGVQHHRQTFKVDSRQFRDWLLEKSYRETGKVASRHSLDEVINTIAARARFDGKRMSVHLRVGRLDDVIYVDLCNETWDVVRVTATDWRVIPYSECPVRFVRAEGMLPLSIPLRGGSVKSLRKFLSLVSDDDWILLLAWMIAAFVPGVPFALLSITGEQGSGKSTVTKMVRSLIDPNKVPLKGFPKNEEDIMINAQNNHIVSYDNLSGLTRQMSDLLCRLSTGGGLTKRQLYTDADEASFSAMRPVILNGIDDLASREDLVDRCLPIETKAIDAARRATDEELWANFEAGRPYILGSLLTHLSRALQRKHSTTPQKLPRMADFYRIATAALGEAFEQAYWRRRDQSTQQVIHSSAFATAIVDFMRDKSEWEGSASELLRQLNFKVGNAVKSCSDWPKAANQITRLLNRKATDLRAVGIAYEKLRKSGTRRIRLSKSAVPYSMDNSGSEPSTTKLLLGQSFGQLDDMDGTFSFSEEYRETVLCCPPDPNLHSASQSSVQTVQPPIDPSIHTLAESDGLDTETSDTSDNARGSSTKIEAEKRPKAENRVCPCGSGVSLEVRCWKCDREPECTEEPFFRYPLRFVS